MLVDRSKIVQRILFAMAIGASAVVQSRADCGPSIAQVYCGGSITAVAGANPDHKGRAGEASVPAFLPQLQSEAGLREETERYAAEIEVLTMEADAGLILSIPVISEETLALAGTQEDEK